MEELREEIGKIVVLKKSKPVDVIDGQLNGRQKATKQK